MFLPQRLTGGTAAQHTATSSLSCLRVACCMSAIMQCWLTTTTAANTPGSLENTVEDWSNVAVVPDLSQYAYFDITSGQRLRHPKYYLFYPEDTFAEGLAVASMTWGGALGYIDRNGKIVIDFRYDSARTFCDGRALVSLNKKPGIIDKSGKWIVKPGQYDYLGEYGDSVCAFRQNRKWGFLDRDGREILPAKYNSFRTPRFADGLCLLDDSASGRGRYIDKDGHVRIELPKTYDALLCENFSNGIARVSTGLPEFGGKAGFIDRTGHLVIPLQYSSAGNFCTEGLVPVSMKSTLVFSRSGYAAGEGGDVFKPNEPWGFIDKNNKVAVPMIYDRVWYFSEGMAPVRRKGRWGYVNKEGREVIPLQYDFAKGFIRGVAMVVIDGKIAYIDKTGRLLLSTGIQHAEF